MKLKILTFLVKKQLWIYIKTQNSTRKSTRFNPRNKLRAKTRKFFSYEFFCKLFKINLEIDEDYRKVKNMCNDRIF